MRNPKAKSGILKRFTFVILTALFAFSASVANAGYYNLGMLDVSPVGKDSAQNNEWFVEYLNPGQTMQEKIRVSNFSPVQTKLLLYVSDAGTTEDKFFAKNPAEKSDDIASWIHLPAESITLEGGQSKILSVNLVTPKNAGVGLHTAAIIVRDITGGEKEVAFEKGVRVYMNIVGPAITKAQNTSYSFSPAGAEINANVTTKNLGTTDFAANSKFEIKDIFGQTVNTVSQETRVKPETQKDTVLTLSKPYFGIYSLAINAGDTSVTSGPILFIPAWAVLLFLASAIAYARPSFKKIRVPDFGSFFRKPVFQKSLVHLAVFGITATLTISFISINPGAVSAQRMKPRVADSYIMTVKLGNLRGIRLPKEYIKNWDIKLIFENATVTTNEYLNFEITDKAEVVDNSTAVRFNNVTGPDNDGIVFTINPTGDEIPNVIYENNRTGEKYTFPITDYIAAPGIYPNSLFAAYFKVELGPELNLTGLAGELEATPEIEATPAPKANIPELENLFVEDLPATPEVLSDFIMNSDYVEKISEENQTQKTDMDSILIEALSATPEVLADITATPDLNFIFVPTEKIVFPPQEFSFGSEKTSSENLGTMIFVQNKAVPWNTYVSTSDFSSMDGKHTIPASSLLIIPGEYRVINTEDGAKIRAGDMRQFKGTYDKSVLVTVQPGEGTEQIFVMNPTLQFTVPPGTRPGHYRGSLTITSL
jgi:hypothetical protein